MALHLKMTIARKKGFITSLDRCIYECCYEVAGCRLLRNGLKMNFLNVIYFKQEMIRDYKTIFRYSLDYCE